MRLFTPVKSVMHSRGLVAVQDESHIHTPRNKLHSAAQVPAHAVLAGALTQLQQHL